MLARILCILCFFCGSIYGTPQEIDKAIKNITTNASTSLTVPQLRKIVEFIEKKLPDAIIKEKFYFSAKEYALPCDVEFDPETKKTFIHTKDIVGKGCIKIFTKTIQYEIEHPKIVIKARVLVKKNKENGEIEALKKLTSVERVAHLVASPIHTENGTAIQEIILRMCSSGPLKDNARTSTLSIREKISLSKDLLEALKDIHSLSIAHSDIHEGNVVFDHNKSPQLKGVRYRFVLVDFGTTSTIQTINGPNVRKDLYAAGCTLYGFYHNRGYTTLLYKKLTKFNDYFTKKPANKNALLIGELTPDLTARKATLDKKKKANTIIPKEALEWIILSMLHPTYEDDRDAAYWYQELEALLPKVPPPPK